MNRVALYGIEIDNASIDEALDAMDRLIEERRRAPERGTAFVVTPNIDHLSKLQRDEEFQDIYRSADLVLADGMPLIWGARLLGKPLKGKVSGSDLFPRFMERAAHSGHRIYLLGAAPGVAEEAGRRLRERFGDLRFVGYYSPPKGFESDAEENDRIVRLIQEAAPDVVFVGLGAPKQEKWIWRHRDQLGVPLAAGVGASFDFEAGRLRRAPRWMQRAGLEWLWRWMCEPRRLFRRYFIESFVFLKLLWRDWRKDSI